jgi:hypothetical protein
LNGAGRKNPIDDHAVPFNAVEDDVRAMRKAPHALSNGAAGAESRKLMTLRLAGPKTVQAPAQKWLPP